jgi:hypothetical protein
MLSTQSELAENERTWERSREPLACPLIELQTYKAVPLRFGLVTLTRKVDEQELVPTGS